ncbi:alpha/beta fold hydrolase [Rhodovulum sp. DZ06]|uniref:alpha/beta fold hydrolase n=1 Tax=Rhodovulum sp. DZ06 TaxID=3425126 RepID=UPI003D350305
MGAPGGDASDALLDDWLDPLLDLAGGGAAPLIAGHREGGILAARAAARALARGRAVAGLALVSTGAPVRDPSQFDAAPKATRRTLAAGRLAGPALQLGYEAAARAFRTGPAAEEKFVRYFCHENPADAAALSDPALFDAVRENLRFCFERPAQVARDVGAWGADWSGALEAAAARVPVLFAHGAAHDFLPLAAVEALVARGPALSCLAVEGAGQLALYRAPERIAAACRALAPGPA